MRRIDVIVSRDYRNCKVRPPSMGRGHGLGKVVERLGKSTVGGIDR